VPKSHDDVLVVLSAVIAVWASYDALQLASRVSVARARARPIWLIAGSLAMGIGIWSMHFVGMLALRLPVRIDYSIPYVALSLAVAVEEAEQLVASHQGTVHLLFTDVVLPGIGGRELAGRVRAARPGIKLLFASGYTDDVILQHRLIAHDITLLQKPFTRESLARKVRDTLDSAKPS
jgi:CheY-like chemotaxis protein